MPLRPRPPSRVPRAARSRRAVAGACASVVLFLLLLLVVQSGLATPGDMAFNAALEPLRSPAVLGAASWITAMGAEPCRFAVLLAASALLWSGPRRVLAPAVWVTVLGSEVTTWLLKYAIARPRPVFLPGVATALSPSFPSAHAAGTLALVGSLAWVVAGGPALRPGQGVRVGLGAAVLVVLIAFSRLVLNVHYPTDIASGLAVGAFWLAVGALLRPETEAGAAPLLSAP